MSRVKGKSDLPEAPQRYRCDECGHVSETYLHAKNPFDKHDTVIGCEVCKSVDSLQSACWKCDAIGSGGYNNSTEYRYVHSCFKHRPRDKT